MFNKNLNKKGRISWQMLDIAKRIFFLESHIKEK